MFRETETKKSIKILIEQKYDPSACATEAYTFVRHSWHMHSGKAKENNLLDIM